MSEETVLRALDIILERRHYPILMLCAQGTHRTSTVVGCLRKLQVILPTAPGVSNEGRSSGTLLVPLSAVSWPWVPAWGPLEPSRPGGENSQKTGKNGEEMGEIRF